MKFLIPIVALALPASAAELPQGLVLHLPFDEAGEKNTVLDTSGKNHTAKRTSGRWYPDGKVRGGSQFWGKNCHLSVKPSDSLNLQQGTVALWFKSDRSHPDGYPLVHRMADGRGFSLGFAGDSKIQFSRGRIAFSVDGCAPVLSDYYLADGSWHHAAATYDGRHLRLFIDGIQQKQTVTASSSKPAAADAPILIGASPETVKAKRALQGFLDEVMIFRRPLKAEEIQAMVEAIDPEAAKPRFTPKQIQGRLRQLKQLHDEGLLTKDFYDRKIDECNVPMN